MQKSYLRATTLLAALAIVSACGDDPAGLESGELTSAEAEAIAEFLLASTVESSFSSLDNSMGGPLAVPFTFETQVSNTVPCPLAGSVAVTADVVISGDTELETGTISVSTTQVHDGCTAVKEGTDIEFSLTGNPNVATTFEASVDGLGDVTVQGSIDGGVTWVSDGRTGDCAIDITYSATGNETTETASASLSGTVCGVTVSQEVTVG